MKLKLLDFIPFPENYVFFYVCLPFPHVPSTGNAQSKIDSPLAWIANSANTNQWITLDLEGDYTITGINIQGRADQTNQQVSWVTMFQITYWRGDQDEIEGDYVDEGFDFTVPDSFLSSNSEIYTVEFGELVHGRYLKIHPVAWVGDEIALRVSVNLCSNWLVRKRTGTLSLKVIP